MIIGRDLAPRLEGAALSAPAVTLTGPRQSGKTTLCRAVFPDHPYISLEATDVRSFATDDPRAFLAQFRQGAIIDEVQRAPDLPSYLQGLIDDDPTPGRWILTGSQRDRGGPRHRESRFADPRGGQISQHPVVSLSPHCSQGSRSPPGPGPMRSAGGVRRRPVPTPNQRNTGPLAPTARHPLSHPRLTSTTSTPDRPKHLPQPHLHLATVYFAPFIAPTRPRSSVRTEQGPPKSKVAGSNPAVGAE